MDGAALTHMWNAGCQVRTGHKWVLQKFKEAVASDEELEAMAKWEAEMAEQAEKQQQRRESSWVPTALQWF